MNCIFLRKKIESLTLQLGSAQNVFLGKQVHAINNQPLTIMKTFDTVTEALADLKSRGYTTDFNLAFNKIMCSTTKTCLTPGDFEITEFYRFEGETNPSDEDIVYGISSRDGKMKGVLMSAFGVYADSISDDMLKKLSIQSSSTKIS